MKCENEAQTDAEKIRTKPFTDVSEEEGAIKDCLVLNSKKSEAVGDALNSRLPINRCFRSLQVKLSSIDQSNSHETDDDALSCTKHCHSTVTDSRQPSKIWSAKIHSQNANYLDGILKEGRPVEEPSSVDEESFRSLSAILCRSIGKSDAGLYRVLAPVCVRAGPAFVRRIFDGQEPLEPSASFQAIVVHRSDERLISEDNSCNESKKDIRIFDESLQTLRV